MISNSWSGCNLVLAFSTLGQSDTRRGVRACRGASISRSQRRLFVCRSFFLSNTTPCSNQTDPWSPTRNSTDCESWFAPRALIGYLTPSFCHNFRMLHYAVLPYREDWLRPVNRQGCRNVESIGLTRKMWIKVFAISSWNFCRMWMHPLDMYSIVGRLPISLMLMVALPKIFFLPVPVFLGKSPNRSFLERASLASSLNILTTSINPRPGLRLSGTFISRCQPPCHQKDPEVASPD